MGLSSLQSFYNQLYSVAVLIAPIMALALEAFYLSYQWHFKKNVYYKVFYCFDLLSFHLISIISRKYFNHVSFYIFSNRLWFLFQTLSHQYIEILFHSLITFLFYIRIYIQMDFIQFCLTWISIFICF